MVQVDLRKILNVAPMS